jgi:hypothetical protein
MNKMYANRQNKTIQKYKEIELLGQYEPNFGGMVLGWPPSKIVYGDPDF